MITLFCVLGVVLQTILNVYIYRIFFTVIVRFVWLILNIQKKTKTILEYNFKENQWKLKIMIKYDHKQREYG